MQLEDRARAAGTALLDAVPDTFDTELGTLRPHRRAPLVAFAALVVLALIGGFVALRPDDHRTRVSSGAGSVPRLIADPPPSGLAATGALDLPLPAPGVGGDIAVYAQPGDDDLSGPGIAILVVHHENQPGPESSVPAVEVRGHQASIGPQGTRLVVGWNESATDSVEVIGQGFEQEALLAAAQSADPSQPALGAPPDGLELVARIRGLVSGSGVNSISHAGATGHVIGYQQPGGTRTVTVSTVEGDESLLVATRYLAMSSSTPVPVRGHRGWVGTFHQNPDTQIVVWQEAAGVVAVATFGGFDQSSALDALSHLREATDAEWDALLKTTSPNSTTPASSASAASSAASFPSPPNNTRGTTAGTSGGASYVAWIDENGNPGITFTTAAGTTTSKSGATASQSFDQPLADVAVFDDQHGVVYGRVPNSVAAVRIVLDSSENAQGTPNSLPGEPFAMFALPVEVAGTNLHDIGITVIFSDAAGNELTRVRVSAS